MRALVTGGCGFAGSHLVERLVATGREVTVMAAPGEPTLSLSAIRDHVELVHCDLRDKEGCFDLVKHHAPDILYHLAAIAFLPDAEADPAGLFAINVGGTINLAKAILQHAPNAKMLYVSSAEVYGMVEPSQIPMTETLPVKPANLYAFSKAFSENLLFDAMERNGLRMTICRPFTHIGPRQSPKFAASGFARQIAQIEKGQAEPVIKVGNMDARRDLMDVVDMAEAYQVAAERVDSPGPFNIGTGLVVRIGEVLDILMNQSSAKLSVEVDPARLRPLDIPIVAGDPAKFSKATGWQPRIPLEATLQSLLDYWRNTV